MRRPYQGLSRSKKNLISDLGNIIAYWEEYYCISAKQGISKQVWFIPENSWEGDIVTVVQPRESFTLI